MTLAELEMTLQLTLIAPEKLIFRYLLEMCNYFLQGGLYFYFSFYSKARRKEGRGVIIRSSSPDIVYELKNVVITSYSTFCV